MRSMTNREILIIGAGGLAKQIVSFLDEKGKVILFDNVSPKIDPFWRDNQVIQTESELRFHFLNHDTSFILGISGRMERKVIEKHIEGLGGQIRSFISEGAVISAHDAEVGEGSVILYDVLVEANVKIGRSVVINNAAILSHDVRIGDYSEVAPGAKLLGRVTIGKNVLVGAGAVVLPGVKVGDNVVIGAGAIVNKNIENDQIVGGIPARPIK